MMVINWLPFLSRGQTKADRTALAADSWRGKTGQGQAHKPLMTIDPHSKPQLAPGVRLGENQGQKVLLMPERALRLNGPSLEIVSRCDGQHTVAQLVAELQKLYAKAEPRKVESDILGYLELLHTQRALNFAS